MVTRAQRIKHLERTVAGAISALRHGRNATWETKAHQAIDDIRTLLAIDPFGEYARQAARDIHHTDGTCEIDEFNAIVSRSKQGAYVEAWVWVDDDDIDRAVIDIARRAE